MNVVISQETQYPWNGDVSINIDQNKAGSFNLMIRIPGWVQNETVPSDVYTYSDGNRLNYSVEVNCVRLTQSTSM